MEKVIDTRSPLVILACTSAECELYGKQNQGNLRVRKIYGRERIRYLRCGVCKGEFSERKGTTLWNLRYQEAQLRLRYDEHPSPRHHQVESSIRS